MVLQQKPESEQIRDALSAGHLTVEDVHGFHHGLYAVCGEDHTRAHPHRTLWTRDADGSRMQQIIFRCHSCGRSWSATVEEMHLA
jgi:hypothetical protein